MWAHKYMCVHTDTLTLSYICTIMHIHNYLQRVLCIYTHIYTCILTHTFVNTMYSHTYLPMHIHTCKAHIYILIHKEFYVYIHTYIHTYLHTHL